MNKSVFFVTLVLLAFTIFQGCETEYIEPEQTSWHSYLPVKEGSYKKYEIDSILIYKTGLIVRKDTISGVLTEEIKNLQTVDSLNFNFEIWRTYYNDLQGSENATTKIWKVEVQDGRWIQNEENLHFHLLNLNMELGTRWKSTLFNAEEVVEYIRQNPINPYILWDSKLNNSSISDDPDLTDYDELLHLERASFTESLLEYRQVDEYYAKNIGLVKAERWILDTQCISCPTDDWVSRAETGFILKQFLIEYN